MPEEWKCESKRPDHEPAMKCMREFNHDGPHAAFNGIEDEWWPVEPNFEGFDPATRECGEHRTVGSHRAWCHDCTEWCYPNAPCRGCEIPQLRSEITNLHAALQEIGSEWSRLERVIGPEAAKLDRVLRKVGLQIQTRNATEEERPAVVARDLVRMGSGEVVMRALDRPWGKA